MHVDRGAFLFLTGAIATAAACASNGPALDAYVIPPANAPGTAIARAPEPMPAAASEPPPAPAPAPAAEGSTDDEIDGPAIEGGVVMNAGSCGRTGAHFDASKPACSDDTGTATACSAMAQPRGCGSFPFPRSKCDAYRSSFKAKIADRAVRCALRLSASALCDACNVYKCGYDALMSACPDSAADSDCQRIARAAGGHVTVGECRSYLSGMNAQGRAAMVRCMASAGNTADADDLYSCAEGI